MIVVVRHSFEVDTFEKWDDTYSVQFSYIMSLHSLAEGRFGPCHVSVRATKVFDTRSKQTHFERQPCR